MFYVGARSLASTLARWLTLDPFWPDEPAYSYVEGAPIWKTDALGSTSCIERSAYYCQEAQTTGNNGLNGICEASNALCYGFILNPFLAACARAWIDCMNNGIYECYSANSTPLWRKQQIICARWGQGSTQCCVATGNAEQNCFTRSLPTCSTLGCPPPWPGLAGTAIGLFPLDLTAKESVRRRQFAWAAC
jgi:hypothetical protein